MVLLTLLLSGCLTADRFDKRVAEEHCLLLTECEALDLYGYSSEAECADETEPVADGCEGFERKVASDCLERMKSMGCEALSDNRFPAACDQVCEEEE